MTAKPTTPIKINAKIPIVIKLRLKFSLEKASLFPLIPRYNTHNNKIDTKIIDRFSCCCHRVVIKDYNIEDNVKNGINFTSHHLFYSTCLFLPHH